MGGSRPTGDHAVGRLLDRIQQVNPTGIGLPRREQTRRYAAKARLQGELVERFGELVHVAWHADMPGIVSLSVPSVSRSAGHAVLESLSVATRDWIERRKDEDAAMAVVGPLAQRLPRETDEMDRARRFVAEYDFDCAEELLEELIVRETGDRQRGALELLLEVFVDHLARNEDAIGLATRMEPELSVRARELAGAAAARGKLWPTALHFLRRCSTTSAVTLLEEVLAGALSELDWSSAAEAWHLLQAAVLAGAGAVGARERARRTSATSLQSFLDRAEAQELAGAKVVRRLARELGVDHVVLRDLDHSERERRVEEARVARRDRLRALVDTDPESREVDALLHAVAAGADALELGEVRALLSAARRRARASALADDLGTAQPNFEACLAYLKQPDDVRAEILARDAKGRAHALERMRISLAGVGRHAAARAATAWFEANSAPRSARWSLLALHAPLLAQVPAFVAELDALRPLSPAAPEKTEPERWSLVGNRSSLGVRVLAAAGEQMARRWLLAPRVLTFDGADHIVLFGDDDHGGLLLLEPIGKGTARALRLDSPCLDAIHITTSGQSVHLLDRRGSRTELAFTAGGVFAHREVMMLAEPARIEEVSDCGRTHLYLKLVGQRAPRLVSSNDEARASVLAASVGVVHGSRRALARFDEDGRVRLLSLVGQPTAEVRLPHGLRVHALLAAPDGSDALVAVATVADEDPGFPMVWWRSGDGAWSALGVEDDTVGDRTRASSFTSLRGRGVAIVIADASEARSVATFASLGADLVRCERSRIDGLLGVVTDPDREVAWVVGSSARGIEIAPLVFRPRLSTRA